MALILVDTSKLLFPAIEEDSIDGKLYYDMAEASAVKTEIEKSGIEVVIVDITVTDNTQPILLDDVEVLTEDWAALEREASDMLAGLEEITLEAFESLFVKTDFEIIPDDLAQIEFIEPKYFQKFKDPEFQDFVDED